MGKVRFHTDYDIDIDIQTDKSVDVYIDSFEKDPVEEGNIRIVILVEPLNLPLLRLVEYFPDSYTYVLTYYEDLIKDNPRAKYFLVANTWVDPLHEYDKQFNVSTITGGKDRLGFKGYKIRHELWNRRGEITIPKKFYLSSNDKLKGADYNNNLVLPHSDDFHNSKTIVFNSQYHIAIENTSINNYFTEKIIDCFLSGTIPIYYGDKNIGRHFNKEGIFEVNSVSEIICVCNKLSEESYELKKDILLENYNKALDFQDYNVRIKNAILKCIS